MYSLAASSPGSDTSLPALVTVLFVLFNRLLSRLLAAVCTLVSSVEVRSRERGCEALELAKLVKKPVDLSRGRLDMGGKRPE
jgi:hypothetical protein